MEVVVTSGPLVITYKLAQCQNSGTPQSKFFYLFKSVMLQLLSE